MHPDDNDTDGPSEAQANIVFEALFANDGKTLPFTGLPAAFRLQGKALPKEEETETKVRHNLGKQLKDQRARDKSAADRRTRMGYDSFGFAFKKGEK